MDSSIDTFESVPIGALTNIPEEAAAGYITQIHKLPPSLFDSATSMKTSEFILGMLKNHGLTVSLGPATALAILMLLLGEKTLAQLPSILSTELKIPTDKAQALAREIERKIIAPVSGELNKYVATRKRVQGSRNQNTSRVITTLPKSNLQSSQVLKSVISRPAIMPKSRLPRKPYVPPNPSNILDLKKKWEQPKPPPIPT